MKINRIDNRSFGYNKRYHDCVHEYFRTLKNKPIASKLLEMDKFCMDLEDDINSKETPNKRNYSSDYLNKSLLLADLRETLAYHIEANFSGLRFIKNTVKEYQQEIKKFSEGTPAYAWRASYINSAASFLTQDEYNALMANAPKDDVKQTTDDIRAQAIDDYERSKTADILTLYKPTSDSPQNFLDVVGMDEVKRMFDEDLVDYIKNPELAKLDEEEYGIKAPRGFLFYGPPGCGKTFITQALAGESGLRMYKMDVSKVGSKYVNQTAVNIQAVFDFLEKQNKQNNSQCILFVDEMDSLAIDRGSSASGSSGENLKVTSTLLKQFEDARSKGIIVIGATNKFSLLDDAIVSRFDKQCYIGLPDEAQRSDLIKTNLNKRKKGVALASDEEAVAELSKAFKGYSNRSIVFVLDSASKLAKRRHRADISKEDVLNALKESKLKKVNEKEYRRGDVDKTKIGFSN